ncbi:hypothetical protein BDV97DRAFT_352819 [Delphinella strobiligena]|nr:hypothetical protein BDV97DRAFT_352819 [Delphinella strobiligena]
MDELMEAATHTMDGTPSKRRSISDAAPSRLEPSPNFHETFICRKSISKDDHDVPSPQTPKRPDLARGLSLHMPPRAVPMAAPMATTRVPLSPQLDTLNASPATSLPRHSRGLDFSRACTNLHHSTLAEQSSPDSSPIIMQKGVGIGIPSRKASVSSMMLDSPNLGPGSTWPQMSLNDRSTVSSSVGSINMLGSDTDTDSDEDELMHPDDQDDPIYATPQVHKLNNISAVTPFANRTASPGPTWSNNFSPAHASLMKTFQRGRFKKERSRKSSSSASGTSAMPSPRTTSPPPLRSIESGGYFAWPRTASNRRESLALGTDQLNISSGNDSGDEAVPTAPTTPGVVRRAVTRRGNLLPKTKGFARIRAALMEESMPVDAEVRREAETMRQVHEHHDNDVDLVANSSPGLMPTVPAGTDGLEDIPEGTAMGVDTNNATIKANPNLSFNIHASRNSAGINYWNKFDKDLRTPPPPSFPTRGSSSLSGDINMDSPAADATRSASVISMTDEPAQTQPTDFARKFGKRRREDDFDIASIKRRAVSPSLSLTNSPVVVASPARSEIIASREGASLTSTWGQPPKTMTRESSMSAAVEPCRRNSNGSTGATMMTTSTVGPPKRVGLQGMVDTNDGIMKMSIE